MNFSWLALLPPPGDGILPCLIAAQVNIYRRQTQAQISRASVSKKVRYRESVVLLGGRNALDFFLNDSFGMSGVQGCGNLADNRNVGWNLGPFFLYPCDYICLNAIKR